MDNIFDDYTPAQLREIFRDPTEEWPDDFAKYMSEQVAYDLFDRWFEQTDDKEYRDRVKDIIEDLTYGYEDDDGNEMLEFDELTENDGQKRLF